MIVTNNWGSVSSMFQSAKFSVHFLMVSHRCSLGFGAAKTNASFFFFLSFHRHCFVIIPLKCLLLYWSQKAPDFDICFIGLLSWTSPVFLCKFNPACLCRQACEWFPLLSVIIRTHTCWSDFKLPVSSLASGHSHRSLKQSSFLLLACFLFYSQWCSPVCCWSFRVCLWTFDSQSQAAIFERTGLFDNLNLFLNELILLK